MNWLQYNREASLPKHQRVKPRPAKNTDVIEFDPTVTPATIGIEVVEHLMPNESLPGNQHNGESPCIS